MPISVVDLGTVTGGALATLTLSNINVPAGSSIFVMCTNGSVNSSSPVPSDNVNGTYTNIGQQQLAGSSLNGSCRMSWLQNSAAISNGTLTFTGDGSGGFGSSMTAFYVSGYVSGFASLRTSGTSFTSSVTTSGNAVIGDFVVGGVGCSGATGQDSNYTSPFTATSFVCGGHMTAAAATSQTYAPSGISGNAAAVIAVFAPGTPIPPTAAITGSWVDNMCGG